MALAPRLHTPLARPTEALAHPEAFEFRGSANQGLEPGFLRSSVGAWGVRSMENQVTQLVRIAVLRSWQTYASLLS